MSSTPSTRAPGWTGWSSPTSGLSHWGYVTLCGIYVFQQILLCTVTKCHSKLFYILLVHVEPWLSLKSNYGTCHIVILNVFFSLIKFFVTDLVSNVTCYGIFQMIFFIFIFVLQCFETIQWRVCYQQGLPCLVFFQYDLVQFNDVVL